MKKLEQHRRRSDPQDPPPRRRRRDSEQDVTAQGYRRSQRSQQSKTRR